MNCTEACWACHMALSALPENGCAGARWGVAPRRNALCGRPMRLKRGGVIETSARGAASDRSGQLHHTSGRVYAVSPDGGTRDRPLKPGERDPPHLSPEGSGGTGGLLQTNTPLRAQKMNYASMRWGQAPTPDEGRGRRVRFAFPCTTLNCAPHRMEGERSRIFSIRPAEKLSIHTCVFLFTHRRRKPRPEGRGASW